MQFYVQKNGKQLGPFTQANIEDMLSNEMLIPTDLVWYDGLKEWITLDSVLADKQEQVPTPPIQLPPESRPTPAESAEVQYLPKTNREDYCRALRDAPVGRWEKMPPMIYTRPASKPESLPQQDPSETNFVCDPLGVSKIVRPETPSEHEARMKRWGRENALARKEGKLRPLQTMPPVLYTPPSSAETPQDVEPPCDSADEVSANLVSDSTGLESLTVPTAIHSTFHAAKKAMAVVGSFALYIAILFGVVVLACAFFKGAAWASLKILPTVALVAAVSGGILIGPAFLFVISRKTRPWLGVAMLSWSYLAGLFLWMCSLLVAWQLWGLGAVIVGVFLAGVGVVPIAFLACLFKAQWETLGQLTVWLVCLVTSRWLASFLIMKDDESLSCPTCSMKLSLTVRNCPYCGGIVRMEKPPLGLIISTWVLMAGFFIPLVGWFCVFPTLATSIMLIRSRNKTGKINGVLALVIFIGIFVFSGLYAWMNPDRFPSQ